MSKKEIEEIINKFIKFLKTQHPIDATTLLKLHCTKKAFIGENITEKR